MKKLANTIISISISQLILVTPYLVCRFAADCIPDKLLLSIATWLGLLASCLASMFLECTYHTPQ